MKNELKWYNTEYIKGDTTIQPVIVNDDTLLFTLLDGRGYHYLFTAIIDLMEYLNGGERTYTAVFETERELINFLMNWSNNIV